MKRICKSLSTAFFAAIISVNLIQFVSADEEAVPSLMLPSGITVSDVDEIFQNYAAKCERTDNVEYASAEIGIFCGDDVLYTGYFGETDLKAHTPADEESVYEWGSISKTLVWVSAMQLYEQGLLDLNRDVREYLPDGFFRHLSYDDPITMLNLMNHNAGWQECMRPCWSHDGDVIPTLKDGLQSLEPAQVHRPGEIVAYSNYGASVAGYVIECITGQDFCTYVHEHIFEPLGMAHTAYAPDHSDNEWVYSRRRKMRSYKNSGMLMSYTDLGACLYYYFAYPAGAATGTLADLMTYGQALVSDDAPLFSSPDTQKLMFTATDYYGDSDIPICAHGFWIEEHAGRVYGHNGAMEFGLANMLFDLDSKTGLVVMINEPNGNWFFSSAPDLVFGTLSPNKYADNAQSAELTGNYLNARSYHRGMLRFIPYLTEASLSNTDVQRISDNVFQLIEDDRAMLIGARDVDGIGTIYELPSQDLIRDKAYLLHLALFTIYVMLAVAAFHFILIRRKKKKHGKLTVQPSSKAIAAGQFAQLISPLLVLLSYVIFAYYHGGIPVLASGIIGIIQIGCIAVCAYSAVRSVITACSAKTAKLTKCKYLLNTLGCTLTCCTILFYEMYRFLDI